MKKTVLIKTLVFIFLFLVFQSFYAVYESTASKSENSKAIERFIEEGQALYDRGDYQGAIDKWTEALKIDPWNEEVKELIDKALKMMSGHAKELDRALKLINEGKLDEAKKIIEDLKKKVSPENRDVYNLLKKSELVLKEKERERTYNELLEKGDICLKNREVDKADYYYNRALKLLPERNEAKERLEKVNELKNEIALEKKVSMLREKGEKLFNENRLEESKNIWLELLKILPEDNEAKLYISKIEFKKREKERLIALGKSYFNAGIKLYRKGEYKKAIDQFENAIAVNYMVEEAKSYISKINQLLIEAEKKKAQEKIEKVAKYLRDGIKLYNLNRFKEALKVLNKGLELDPDNDQIKEYIVRVSVAIKRQEEKRVPSTSPFYPLVENLKRLGIKEYRSGNYGESIKYWEEILLIFPFNEDARINLTKALKRTDPKLASDIVRNLLNEAKNLLEGGKKREALAKVKTVLEVDPKNVVAGRLFKEINSQLESKKKVITKEMINKAKSLYDQGVAAYQKEKLEDAISLWKEALSVYPDYIEARIALARAETQLRNLKLLEQRVTQGSTKNTEISIRIKRHYIDGLNYYMNGLYREAISEWEQILKINPNDEKIKQNILKAKKRLQLQGEQVG